MSDADWELDDWELFCGIADLSADVRHERTYVDVQTLQQLADATLLETSSLKGDLLDGEYRLTELTDIAATVDGEVQFRVRVVERTPSLYLQVDRVRVREATAEGLQSFYEEFEWMANDGRHGYEWYRFRLDIPAGAASLTR